MTKALKQLKEKFHWEKIKGREEVSTKCLDKSIKHKNQSKGQMAGPRKCLNAFSLISLQVSELRFTEPKLKACFALTA
jgi:hypothetical protein